MLWQVPEIALGLLSDALGEGAGEVAALLLGHGLDDGDNVLEGGSGDADVEAAGADGGNDLWKITWKC